jgi:hypothetical protein
MGDVMRKSVFLTLLMGIILLIFGGDRAVSQE